MTGEERLQQPLSADDPLARDLYPFCVRLGDGKILVSAVAVLAGTDTRTKDPNGKAFGEEMYKIEVSSPEGKITEVSGIYSPNPAPLRQPFPSRPT